MSEQFCTFWLNNIYFGINVQHVQEVIRSQVITRVPLAPPDVCGLINLRGQIIPVIDLQKRLNIGTQEHLSDSQLKHESDFSRYLADPSPNLSPGRREALISPPSLVGKGAGGLGFLHDMKTQKHESGFNIVVYFDNEVVSLLVDDVGDVLEFPENTFQLPPATLKGRMRQVLAGAYPLSEGFLLVVDTEKILNIK
ncbi:hypothetical protein NOS3756_49700 [Nostoc sp. NIES-3756]|uniref:chemotaxis protein CheW n=1 Tax=Nostoc sp. NIES-3756 TaxID=1751286 RepID=UPI000722BF92|nr:chemotaxis protein CheW [Nostoc sp. NIES-3756]BAT55973.1 hypothetical protein NOS3756_49700 [Nostoc sp. NIES-3756]